MTGSTFSAAKREKYWREKRVFFLTPQIAKNDIQKGVCPAKSVVLLVLDEAHKAQGKYSYCVVVQQVAAATRHFRVIGLTATPGPNAVAIQNVISNLMISRFPTHSCKH